MVFVKECPPKQDALSSKTEEEEGEKHWVHKQKRRRHSFPRKHRLNSRKSIDLLFQKGRYQSCGFLRFRCLPQTDGYTRVVISISKRAGDAPVRNRLKRLIREALRLSPHLHDQSLDCAFFITNPLNKPPSLTEIQERIEYIFTHLPDEAT